MINTPGAILTLGLGGSPALVVTLGYGIGAPVVNTLIGRKKPRRRRLPEVVIADEVPQILAKVSDEKDYLQEVLAEANTELTIAALSTDNAEKRQKKLQEIGLSIAQIEADIAEAEDEEAFLMLVLQAAEIMF